MAIFAPRRKAAKFCHPGWTSPYQYQKFGLVATELLCEGVYANDQQQVGSKATLNQRRELWKPYLRFAAPKLFSPLQFLALEGEMSAFQEQAWQLEYITAPPALSRLILFLSLLDQETKKLRREIWQTLIKHTNTGTLYLKCNLKMESGPQHKGSCTYYVIS